MNLGNIIKHNTLFCLFITFIWIIYHYKNNWAVCCGKYTLTVCYRTVIVGRLWWNVQCGEIVMECSFYRHVRRNSIKHVQWGPTLEQRQTDTHTVTFHNFTKANTIGEVIWGSKWGKILYLNEFKPVVIIYSKWMDWTEVQSDKATVKYYNGEISTTLDIIYLQGRSGFVKNSKLNTCVFAVVQLMWHCATGWKVPCSFPDVTVVIHLLKL
jgi:hypothetical protein